MTAETGRYGIAGSSLRAAKLTAKAQYEVRRFLRLFDLQHLVPPKPPGRPKKRR
jgi:hypothetical protein